MTAALREADYRMQKWQEVMFEDRICFQKLDQIFRSRSFDLIDSFDICKKGNQSF